ncbi:MAG: L-aspartate oxidase [Opitutales bacterium]
MQIDQTDCLVIGAGLAGAAYAFEAAKAGLTVTVLSAENPLDAANSGWAQGGIIYHRPEDMPALAMDIEKASGGTANPVAVQTLVEDGPAAVKEFLLDELKVGFDREVGGDSLMYTREGGHSQRRIIFAKDATGHSILSAAHRRILAMPEVAFRAGTMAVDLLTLSHSSVRYVDRYQPLTCVGAYILDTKTARISALLARKVVLATGGLGQIFTHTTNRPGCFGHGIAMAYRVGARIMDLEYIQFHPTAFCKKGAPTFLISEAVRGEGAVLLGENGERFMEDAHPLKELAPRDFVARSIYQQLARQNDNAVYMDLSAMPPSFIRERFPSIYERCKTHGVDITREPIPVAPAAHYLCGGVHADLDGRTTVRHLNAIGETACTGLHGANRLASTSLLECLVSARRAAWADAAEIRENAFYLPEVRTWASPTREPDAHLIKQDFQLIQNTMTNYVGIVRSPARLERSRRILGELRREVDQFYADCRITPDLLNLRNAIRTALLVVHAATLNRSSRGCHYREDYPPRADEAELDPDALTPNR